MRERGERGSVAYSDIKIYLFIIVNSDNNRYNNNLNIMFPIVCHQTQHTTTTSTHTPITRFLTSIFFLCSSDNALLYNSSDITTRNTMDNVSILFFYFSENEIIRWLINFVD